MSLENIILGKTSRIQRNMYCNLLDTHMKFDRHTKLCCCWKETSEALLSSHVSHKQTSLRAGHMSEGLRHHMCES